MQPNSTVDRYDFCHGSFEPMAGRPMREYVEVPPEMMKNEAELRKWVKKGMEYTKNLPPKKKQ